MGTWENLAKVWYNTKAEAMASGDPKAFLEKAIMLSKGEAGKRKLESAVRESAPDKELADEVLNRIQVVRNGLDLRMSAEDILNSLPPLRWGITPLRTVDAKQCFSYESNIIPTVTWDEESGIRQCFCPDYMYVCENANVFGNALLTDRQCGGDAWKAMAAAYKSAVANNITPFPMVVLRPAFDMQSVRKEIGASRIRRIVSGDTFYLYKYKQVNGVVYIMEMR